MRLGWQIGLLSAILLVELVGLGFFIKGFFPYKKSIPGFASQHEQPPDIGQQQQQQGHKGHAAHQYDRLVIMLVDALRNDFVFGNNSAMAYTQDLLRDGQAIGFTAKALAPTVTMPRIKALMTGTVPNFLDAVLNIAESDTSSSLKFQDNLLWQLKNQGKTINMFGDDTWLRLFPDVFSRTDGTSSFFVTDTVEVDNNVTRHVRPDLERDDWDVTIFHYLGLDHIGHLAGPDSSLMRPKQQEMDQVVQTIFETISRQDTERMRSDSNAKPTLFVLLGDHAMNEIGNHGGNSHLETSTVFVFMGQGIRGQPIADQGKNALSALLTKEVSQINLVPTLALLFGVPVPKNNLGMPLPELLEGYQEGERLRLLQLAAHQIYGVVQANDPDLADVEAQTADNKVPQCDEDNESVSDFLRCKYVRALVAHHRFAQSSSIPGSTETSALAGVTESEYYNFMEHASAHLSRTFSGYDLEAMMTGISAFGVVTLALAVLYQCSSGISGSGGSGVVNFKAKRLSVTMPAVVLLITYIVSMVSSSLIEEEHQFWYFWVQTMLALRVLTSSTFGAALRSLTQMGLFRVIRVWNQTGQKWTGEADIRQYLNSGNVQLMWTLVILSFVLFAVCAQRIHSCAADLRAKEGTQTASQPGNAAIIKYRWRLALGQQAFRSLLAGSLFNALVYQMDRNSGWEVLGIVRSAWSLVRWFTPSDLADVARLIYLLTFLMAAAGAICMWLRARSDHPDPLSVATLEGLVGMLPLLTLLARPHNIPLFAMFLGIFFLFFPGALLPAQPHSCINPNAVLQPRGEFAAARLGEWRLPTLRPSKQLVQLCLIHASFFALGNSNSLASLDLSNAYAGVSRYNESLVGILMFTGNWAGPLWWTMAAFSTLALSSTATGSFGGRTQKLVDWLVAAHLWQACAILTLSIVVTMMRTHLFIWSVFSPRYLYQIAWFAGFYLVYATVGGMLWMTSLAQLSP
ncbi:hypothetical protein BX661DRAFT_195383 [Kickxella alabastrina]|uniref:uncharacterized protein n=1 Tax=Kickxella alabastrina TaxID=61397 RepID=UPI0022203FC7|nr:uncharacterized protein BX661DRAFT_195383 [Kickxella alabastrina]KAI7834784.1 hypothetical protein BX661DRAFT_195383 [Kickxella alabastrina]KAJ1947486.1 major facilitator super transporter protein [Kickxella alabastrina]